MIKEQASPNSIQQVVWLQTAFIGDLVLTTAAMKMLHDLKPWMGQHVITTEIGSKIFSSLPFLKSVQVVGKTKWFSLISDAKRIRGALRREECRSDNTVLLQAHRSYRSYLLRVCLGFPSVTFHESSGAIFATHTVPRVGVLHEVDRLARLLEPLQIFRDENSCLLPSLEVFPNFTPSANWIHFFEQSIRSGEKLIAIAPGSVWATKRWPIEKFAALTLNICRENAVKVVLLGSHSEKEDCQKISRRLQENRIPSHKWLDLSGETSIEDLKWLYPRLSGLISNDSSPIHFASAFQVPTIAIFGATVSGMGFGPLARGSSVIEKESLPCRPCSSHGPRKCPLKHFLCMESIGVEEVFHRVKSLFFS